MGRLTPMPRIYGRDAEIATLAEALDRAASGRLAVVLIEGEAGIGKSGCWRKLWSRHAAGACRSPRAGPRSFSGRGRSV